MALALWNLLNYTGRYLILRRIEKLKASMLFLNTREKERKEGNQFSPPANNPPAMTIFQMLRYLFQDLVFQGFDQVAF